MTSVLVHPSRGHRDGRVNWGRSLDVTVDFVSDALGGTLTQHERNELLMRHPDGRAHFWGTYAYNGGLLRRIVEGDVVVFTGQGGIWGIGAVGYMFDNPSFAERLWVESEGKGTYRHIYSLKRFDPVRLPYSILNEPLHYKPNNFFQGMAVYDDPYRATALIESLTRQRTPMEDALYEEIDSALARELEIEIAAASSLAPLEQVRTLVTTISFAAGSRTIRRGEGSLVLAYAASLGTDVSSGRNFMASGVTDICIDGPGGRELVEAKSSQGRSFVRQALAQLLDYGPSMRPRPAVLTALFPSAPDKSAIDLLHRYGIDCVYRIGPSEFDRLDAPAIARDQVLELQL